MGESEAGTPPPPEDDWFDQVDLAPVDDEGEGGEGGVEVPDGEEGTSGEEEEEREEEEEPPQKKSRFTPLGHHSTACSAGARNDRHTLRGKEMCSRISAVCVH